MGQLNVYWGLGASAHTQTCLPLPLHLPLEVEAVGVTRGEMPKLGEEAMDDGEGAMDVGALGRHLGRSAESR